MGDHDIWRGWKPPECAIRPGLSCEVRKRVDERTAALACRIGQLAFSKEHDFHTQDELNQLGREIESLHQAFQMIELIEQVLEERRKEESN